MSDTPSKTRPPRAQHVVAHIDDKLGTKANPVYDDVYVFGTELEALRFMLGKPGLVYAALRHGQSFADQAVVR